MSTLLSQDVFLETLLWTGILIAAVLLVRRPVARWLGPQVAYALWAVPMLRLILPRVELPGWMRPVAPESAPADATPFPVLDPLVSAESPHEATGFEVAATDAIAPHAPTPVIELDPFVDTSTLIELGLAVWFIGAAIFLYLRFGAYFRLRDDLLEGGSEVGRVTVATGGKVRLVETPGTNAPLAFGVIDKVIALPPGFLAQFDRQARDLALAHEMAHHEGRDLLVNVLVQPLFAMHWWNPLCRYGWLALRRDQEAACDARVMASAYCDKRPEARPEIREAYANLIVSFAANPNASPHHALTAPMACPVLGDKSIIHRLRSLNMTETTNNRRLAGRLMLGAAVLALPLTASISYAASEAPAPPAPPEAPLPPLAPPAPPAPPSASLAPQAEPAPYADEERIEEVDPDVDVDFQPEPRVSKHTYTFHSVDGDGELSVEERQEIMIELRESLAEARAELDELPRIIEEAMAEAEEAQSEAMKHRTVVEMKCDKNSNEVTTTRETAGGSHVVMICQSRIMAHALEGLKEARKAIARNKEMSAKMRDDVTAELDREIERWESRGS